MDRDTPIPELVVPVTLLGLVIVLYGAHLETLGVYPEATIFQFGGMVVTALPVLAIAVYLVAIDSPDEEGASSH